MRAWEGADSGATELVNLSRVLALMDCAGIRIFASRFYNNKAEMSPSFDGWEGETYRETPELLRR